VQYFDREGHSVIGVDNDIRREFKEHRFDAILHCAAQPSHHKAKENPRPGEVYNIGRRENSISIREAFNRVDQLVGTRSPWEYRDEARKGDHICYISDLRKLRSHFPNWNFTSTWILERLWSQRKNT
jgi:nucleoside-diphosphate-sugar epimerase